MIRLFLLIIALSAPYVSSQSFGLFTIADQPLELLKLETQVKVECESYARIQYTFLYKNPLNNSIQTKFVFPPTSNALFHQFEATSQNQTFTTKVVEESAAQTLKTESSYLGFPNIPPNETVHIEFIMIQPLGVIVSKFYELKLPAFINGDAGNLSPEDWNIQIELESRDEFVVLSNPTHRLVPEIWSSEGDLFRAFWNVTVAPNKEFAVYFGPENLRNYTIRLTDPHDSNANMRLYNLVPNRKALSAREAQNMLESTPDAVLKIKKIAAQSDFQKLEATCVFVIDRSDSMKGSSIELLKKTLKVLLSDIAPYCEDFHIVSFGSSFEHYNSARSLSGFEDIQKAMEWTDTIEADMGGSNLSKALRYTYELFRSRPGWPITVILTDGDVSESVKADSTYFVVGIGEASKGFIHFEKDYSEFVTDHKDLGDQEVLNFLIRLNRASPECAFTFGTAEGNAERNRLFYKSNRYWYSFVPNEAASSDLFYETGESMLKTCGRYYYGDGCHGGLRELFREEHYDNYSDDDDYSEEKDFSEDSLFEVYDTNITGIWRTVVDVIELRKLEDVATCCDSCDEDDGLDLQRRITELSLERQVSVRWLTSLVLQTKPSTSKSKTYSAEFFDLSKFNRDVRYYVSKIIEIPEDYIPLDSIVLKAAESIEL